MTPSKDLRISNQVLTDIIRVFLLGLPWENVREGDVIIDLTTNSVWCRWRDIQSLRPMIINHLKGYEKTKALALEIERVIENQGG